MFPFIRKRLDRATLDFVAFAKQHIPGLILALLAGAISLPLVQIVAGADMKQEAGLLFLYGLVGPLAVISLAFVVFYIRASGKLYAEALAKAPIESSSLVTARDVSIGQAIAYLAFGSWGRTFEEAAASREVSGEWEYKQFQQAAADGDIPVWGRTGKSRVFEPIPKEFWRQNHFDWFNLLRGDSGTEPIAKRDYNEVRYSETMTSKAATELYFKKQPPEVLRAKSSARQLSNLLNDAAIERNKLVPHPLEPFDAERCEQVLIDWDRRALAALDKAGVKEGSYSKFKTLDTWVPDVHGSDGRSPEQVRLEVIWNKKIRILQTIIDEISE